MDEDSRSPLVQQEDARPLADRVLAFLPHQGSFEVQHDQPGKTHNWHMHSLSETLFVVNGELGLFWQSSGGVHRQTCGPNTRIDLPQRLLHGSTAGAQGAMYLILPEGGATAATTFLAPEDYPAE
jgi:hypothetical protein